LISAAGREIKSLRLRLRVARGSEALKRIRFRRNRSALWIHDWRTFLSANRRPPRIKSEGRRSPGYALALVEAVAEDAERGAGIGADPAGVAVDLRFAAEFRGLIVEADGPALRAVRVGDQQAAILRLRPIPLAAVLVSNSVVKVLPPNGPDSK